MEKTDIELAIAAQSGDSTAFGSLYERYIRQIYRYFSFRTDRRETAEDLTSQTFIKALEYLKSFKPDKGSWSSWLYRIAHNNLVDHLRKTRGTEDIELVWETLAAPGSTDTQVEARIQLEKASKIIEVLPKETRDIIIMRVWDQLSYAEIASIVGKSEAACKMTASRGFKTLREHLPLPVALFFLIHLT
jgi:RNA polymerase sigma-70 factor (ECF subfamily)